VVLAALLTSTARRWFHSLTNQTFLLLPENMVVDAYITTCEVQLACQPGILNRAVVGPNHGPGTFTADPIIQLSSSKFKRFASALVSNPWNFLLFLHFWPKNRLDP
jgi:hypothetical protein